MRTVTFSLALGVACVISFLASPAWAAQWTMIDGTDQRWWIDAESITKDAKQGVTFFTESMSDQTAVPPDDRSAAMGIATVRAAIDCATGEEFTYSYGDDDDDNGHWTKEMSKWPPEYHASVRRIVCKP